MKFYLYNHQNKGLAFAKALEAAGWEWTARSDNVQAVFTDVDVKVRNKALLGFHQRGAKIFIYPHAARPNLFNDFPGYEPFLYTACQFVVSEGHKEIMRAYGHPHKLESIGWSLCPIKPFKARASYRNVLFAPIHPNSDGGMADIQMQMNIDTYKKLLPLVDAGEIDLTVRLVRSIPQNGLWEHPGVKFIGGKLDLSYAEIDQADLVVSHQTFAFLAVARGVPTVMMGEYNSPVICERKVNAYPKSWDKYKGLLMYPLDILVEADTRALFARAVFTDVEIADWRARLIGEQFDPIKFVEIVKSYM